MKGKKLSEFIDELFINPELELIYHNTKYLISGYIDENNSYTLIVNILGANVDKIFEVSNSDRNICVSKFEETKLFEGLTVYEAESEIEVLYG